MADSDRTLKILLEVQARLDELRGLNSELDKTKGKLKETGDAAAGSAGKISPIIAGIASSLGLGLAGLLTSVPFIIQGIGEEVRKLSEDQKKITDELERTTDKYIQLARVAADAGDVLNVGRALVAGLDQSEARFDEFRKRELGLWDTFKNSLTTIPFLTPEGTLQPALEAARAAAEQDFRTQLVRFTVLRQVAEDSAAAIARIQTLPVAQGLAEVNQNIALLKAEMATLAQAAVPPINATGEELKRSAAAAQEFIDKSALLSNWERALQKVQNEARKVQEALFDAAAAVQGVQSQIRSNLAAAVGDTAGVLEERLSNLQRDTFNKLFNSGTDAVEAARLAEQMVNSEREKVAFQEQSRAAAAGVRAEVSGESGIRQEVLLYLREEATLLQSIRQQEQLISSNDLLTNEQKRASLAGLLPEQIAALHTQIAQGRALLAGSALDPATYEQVNQKIQQASFQLQSLQQKMQTTGFSGQFRVELVNWVNQIGTVAQQTAGLITNTLGSAINGISSAITGLIFRTQSLGEAALQMGAQFVQSLINVGLQMVAQKILSSVLTSQTVAEQSASGSAIAAANAPAAAATSIASFGASAVVGTIAAVAAIAAIIAAIAGGGFEAGGYTGGREGRIAGVVHGEEYVIPAPVLRAFGGPAYFDNLSIAATGAGYARGGYTGGSGGAGPAPAGGGLKVEVLNFTDPRALRARLLQSTEARRIIVDVVRGSAIELGIS